MKQKYTNLFKPKNIAVIGASGDKKKIGHVIARNVIDGGYAGDVYLVNPHRKKILGRKVFSSLKEVDKTVDCAIVAVPGHMVEKVIEENSHNCKNFVVISAGFGESGVDGHNRELNLYDLAKRKNLTILGPNCLGFLNPHLDLNASFAPDMPGRGGTALISQSGALAVALLDRAEQYNIGFSSVVTIGNKMMIGASELITYYVNDPDTDTIALYLEGINNGTKFLKALQKARSAGKRIIVLKSGVSKEGQNAIALHTGSLAGEDDIFSAALSKYDVVRAQTIEHFISIIRCESKFLNKEKKPPLKTCVVTNAGGPGVLVTDLIAHSKDIVLSQLSKEVREKLQRTLPDGASVMNPVDLLGDASVERYDHALEELGKVKDIDIVFIILTPQDTTPVKKIAECIAKHAQKNKKIYIATFIGGERVKSGIQILQKNDILHFDTPATALSAIDSLIKSSETFSQKNILVDSDRIEKVNKILEKSPDGGILYYDDSAKIASLYDLYISSFTDITRGISADMKIQFPCVAKIDDPTILHKTDVGGVITHIKNLKELTSALKVMRAQFRQETSRVVVQKMYQKDMELVIGLKRDPVFGEIVVVGLGGIYVEFLDLVEHFIMPSSKKEIVHKLQQGKIGFLFQKSRGEKCYNVESVAHTAFQLYVLGKENPQIKAIDINPYLAYSNDAKDIIVDIKILK